MKRLLSLLLSALLLLSLAGCSNSDNYNCLPEDLPADRFETNFSTLRCRVVSVSDDNVLLLASMEGEHPDIYTLTADMALTAGEMVEVAYTGEIQETYPAQFSDVQDIGVVPDQFNDLCTLYLWVLYDLWEKDEGLNDGVEMISVDLSATSLSPAERSAVAWRFAQLHGISSPLELNYEELCAEGYISGLTEEEQFPAWDNGMLFTITETDDPAAFSLPDTKDGDAEPSMTEYNVKSTVSFDASKWRTALGAYGFSACTAAQDNDGRWGDYHINGGEWIS